MKQTTKNTFAREIPALVIVFMAFGLVPISSNPRLQVFFQFYQLLLGAVIIAIFVYVTFFVGFTQGAISAPVSGMVFISKILAHLVILLEAYFTRGKQQEFFETLTEINESFRMKLGLHFDPIKIKRVVKRRIIPLIVIPTICTIMLLVRAYQLSRIMPWYATYPAITLLVRGVQNMIYVTLVEGHLNFLNEKIEEIMLRNAHFQPFTIFAQEYRQLSKTQKTERLAEIPENKRILEMKQIFNRLWDAMNLINDSFGWSLLIISISYFLSITTCAFYLFVALEAITPSLYLMIHVISTLIPIIIILAIFAWACQSCARNGHDTGTLLQKIKKVEDEAYNFLVSEFQLQVMHEPFEMSAHGFFTINFEFLGSMAAASVTYLVILIQFVYNEAKAVEVD